MLALSQEMAAWAPALLVVGLAYGVVPWMRRDISWHRTLLALAATLLSVRYITWRFSETLAPLGFTWDALASWSFFVIEAMALVSSLSSFALLSRTRSRSGDADRQHGWWGERQPKVAILIATYNEEWAVLERTIAGAKALRWTEKQIYVLDDGRRDWLKDKCKTAGVIHMTRPDNSHGKAGNINHALERLCESGTPPAFVAVLDADFVPHLGFVSRSLSLFADEKIGLVQTPQHFFNPDPIQHNLGISRAYPDEQRFFFDHVQPARDAWGIAVCCGTSSIIRWDALDGLGGFPTDSVTEDYLLTVRLQEIGYKTAYLNEPLSEGLAPEGLKEYIIQRARWGMGLMQIVRGPSGPQKANKLRLRDRWSLADSFMFWASIFPFKIACIVYPLLYWYFGVIVVDADINEIIANFIPYYLMSMVFMNFVSRGLFVPVVHDVSQLVGAFEITRGVYSGLFRPKGQTFKVTMKGGDRSKVTIQWPLLSRFLVLIALTVVGLVIGLTSGYAFDGRAGDGKVVIMFWTIYNLVALTLVALVCVEMPRTASVLRAIPEHTLVHAPMGERQAWLVDINEDAIRLRGVEVPAQTEFIVEVAGLGPIRATATRAVGSTTEARIALAPDQRELLLEKIHTREGEPGTGIVAIAELFTGLLRRAISGTVRG